MVITLNSVEEMLGKKYVTKNGQHCWFVQRPNQQYEINYQTPGDKFIRPASVTWEIEGAWVLGEVVEILNRELKFPLELVEVQSVVEDQEAV